MIPGGRGALCILFAHLERRPKIEEFACQGPDALVTVA